MKVVKDRAGMKAAHQDMMAKLEDDVVVSSEESSPRGGPTSVELKV